MRPTGKFKICLTASAGGHLNQLLAMKPIWEEYIPVCVSTGEMVRSKLEAIGKTYIVDECNRRHPVRSAMVLLHCLRIYRAERPDVVLSTGAAVGFLMCFWGKLFGSRIIWVDSVANTRRLSMSGRMVRPFADLILSQWPDVAARYPNVEYIGELI